MTDGFDVAELVSGLMANARTAGERRAIVLLADGGMFNDPAFIRHYVEPRGDTVLWQRVQRSWVGMDEHSERRAVLRDSSLMALVAQTRPPESLEDLQVQISLDEPEGIVLAAWRDAYAADPREPNPYHHHVDLCLDELINRSLCWNCGRAANSTTVDDRPVCSTCKENR